MDQALTVKNDDTNQISPWQAFADETLATAIAGDFCWCSRKASGTEAKVRPSFRQKPVFSLICPRYGPAG